MGSRDLTERERAIYRYLIKDDLECPPTIREIQRDLGISSTSVVHNALNSLCEKGLIERDGRSSRSIRIPNRPPVARVPLIGRVTAGRPILAVEQIEDYLPIPKNFGGENLFALRVVGLSMRDAGILDGDIVIADRDQVAQTGDIIIALIGDEATVKRLGTQNGRPVLYPENPDYEPIYPETLTVLGRVVGSFRRF